MKKITIWLTATAAAIALVLAYQLNVAGVGGKDGGADRPPAAATAPANPSAGSTPSSSNRSSSDGATTDHTDKPGESK